MQTDQWRVEEKQYSCPVVMGGSDTSGDLEIVAKCYGIEGHKALEIARLIAAAPELLAALKSIMELYFQGQIVIEGEADEGDDPVVGAAMHAIAKAEGRSE